MKKTLGTDHESQVNMEMRLFGMSREQADRTVTQGEKFNDAFAGPTKGITALDTNRLIALEKVGAQALEGISGELVVSKRAFAELVKGSTLEKANALLEKFGIQKFFGVKNGAAFEGALDQGLKLGLSPGDAAILATAKAQGAALATNDKAIIEAAKTIGVKIR